MIQKNENKKDAIGKIIVKVIIFFLFVAYLIFLLNALLFDQNRIIAREMMSQNRSQFINLVPFESITKYVNDFQYFNLGDWMINIFGNIIAFLPIGVAITALSGKTRKFYKSLIIGVFLSFSIEILQLNYNLGVFDIDDIMLNALGYLIGYILFMRIYNAIILRYSC